MLRPPAEEVRVLVYPDIDPETLICSDAPDVPVAVLGVTQDTDTPIQETWLAYADCKAKLTKVRDLVATWHKTP